MKFKKGFTLIELLVVISIIALLMAILMPALTKVRDQAKSTVCKAQLGQWGKIFGLYLNDNNQRFMEGKDGYLWVIPLKPYYKDGGEAMRMCPCATKEPAGGVNLQFAKRNECFMIDDSWLALEPGEIYKGSYGINNWLYSPKGSTHWKFSTAYNWRTGNAKNPTNIPVFSDCARWGGNPQHTDPPSDDPEGPETDSSGNLLSGTDLQRFAIDRHRGKNNVLFLDYSVRDYKLKELWTLKWSKNFDTHYNDDKTDWPKYMK